MPHIVWFLAGAVGGWYLHRYFTTDPDRIAASLQRETGNVLDAIGRMHQTGALGQMNDMNLSHGGPKNRIELQIRTKQTPYEFYR